MIPNPFSLLPRVIVALGGGLITAMVWFLMDRYLFGNHNDEYYYYGAVMFAFATGWLSADKTKKE
jgi:hypothetical protein